MAQRNKVKLSITVSPTLLKEIDGFAKHSKGLSRSSVIEQWLSNAAFRARKKSLDQQTVEYYQQLSAEAEADDETWSRKATQQFSKLEID